jgi:hypothetical protein
MEPTKPKQPPTDEELRALGFEVLPPSGRGYILPEAVPAAMLFDGTYDYTGPIGVTEMMTLAYYHGIQVRSWLMAEQTESGIPRIVLGLCG